MKRWVCRCSSIVFKQNAIWFWFWKSFMLQVHVIYNLSLLHAKVFSKAFLFSENVLDHLPWAQFSFQLDKPRMCPFGWKLAKYQEMENNFLSLTMGITLSPDFPRYKHGMCHTEDHLPQWLVQCQEEVRRIKMDENWSNKREEKPKYFPICSKSWLLLCCGSLPEKYLKTK